MARPPARRGPSLPRAGTPLGLLPVTTQAFTQPSDATPPLHLATTPLPQLLRPPLPLTLQSTDPSPLPLKKSHTRAAPRIQLPQPDSSALPAPDISASRPNRRWCPAPHEPLPIASRWPRLGSDPARASSSDSVP
ncbi:hypothetical protein HNY73_012577 [Argiope bruennichi]|uniref:Uncharacterized protein n=1 Tax=Argiope bruennichi TaxID=94029 RepID=A0A8T0EX56_ARGBR|nr:hypothetical protein HNY73_012577 [Argiope bruennichi]